MGSPAAVMTISIHSSMASNSVSEKDSMSLLRSSTEKRYGEEDAAALGEEADESEDDADADDAEVESAVVLAFCCFAELAMTHACFKSITNLGFLKGSS